MTIETKPRGCRGIGKAYGVTGCGQPKKYRTFGLCNECLSDFLFNTDKGKLIMERKIIPKAKQKIKLEQSKADSQKRESLKTLSDWKKTLQTEINTIVRLIDNGHPCIATGRTTGKRNAGHYLSVGSNDTIRFHLENIWIQSEESNTYQSGDTIKYQQGIIDLYGKEYLECLNALKMIQPIKLTIDDIKEKIPITRGIIKWLKLQDRVFDKSERLSLRQKFNLEIGIYESR